MSFQVTGKVHKIFDTEQVTDSFEKRVVVLEYAPNPMYPQLVSFEFVQNAVTAPDNVQEGEIAMIEFDLSGREWESPKGEVKYFNTLRAWKIMPAQQGETPVEEQGRVQQQDPPKNKSTQDEPEDDLPF